MSLLRVAALRVQLGGGIIVFCSGHRGPYVHTAFVSACGIMRNKIAYDVRVLW
jgi:hypothetical protein